VRIEVLSPTIDDGRDVTVLVDGVDVSWDIRRPECEKAVSPVSAYRGVREAMRIQQRRIGERGRVVMVGRDIGTVVLPEADLKFFLTASADERALRRHRDLSRGHSSMTLDEVLRQQRQRDLQDTSRAESPLQVARGSVVIDTTGLSLEEVVGRLFAEVGELLQRNA